MWPFEDIAAALVGGPALAIGASSGIFGSSGDQTACLAQANVDTSGLDAKIATIAAWTPSDYFTSSQVYQIANQTNALIGVAVAQVNAAPNSTSDASSAISADLAKLSDQAAQSAAFITAAAQNTDATLYSPGLKTWVINSMNAASNSITDAYTLQCAQGPLVSAIQSALSALGSALDSLWSVLSGIAGVAQAEVEAALAAGQTIASIPDAVASLAKNLMYGTLVLGLLAVGGGSYYVYRRYGGFGRAVEYHSRKYLKPIEIERLEGARRRRRLA